MPSQHHNTNIIHIGYPDCLHRACCICVLGLRRLYVPPLHPHDFANFSAPLRSRLSNIHLPPQELSDVISGMSLRRVSADSLRPTSGRRLAPSLSKVASRTQTPTRRLSGNLTVRRRRRSSAGIVYDAGYAGPVTGNSFVPSLSGSSIRQEASVTRG